MWPRSTSDPPRRIRRGVSSMRWPAATVDTAIAWGPLAGYFASRERVPLRIARVTPERRGQGLSFTFEIAMGVRRGDRALRRVERRARAARRSDDAILRRYGVPLLPLGARS